MAAANSPYDRAAIRVRVAATIQVMISSPGDWVCLAMAAGTMKMPGPIIDPMTSVVESTRPRPFTKRLAMRVYCTAPVLHALANRRGGALCRKQIGDHGQPIGAGVERFLRVAARDPADRHQRLRGEPAQLA